jgi:hypothetical protein
MTLLLLIIISISGSFVLSSLGTARAQEGLPAPNTNGQLSLPSPQSPNTNIINNTNNSNTMNLPNSPLQPLFK